MSDNWNWHDEDVKELTIIPRVRAIAVYRNDHNEVVIRQQGFDMDMEDQIIVFPEEKLGTIITALQAELALSKNF